MDALAGHGDSGDLGQDLTELFVALGEAAQEQGTGVIFLLDEVQYLKPEELEAVIAALHKCSRRSLPVTMVGAGLPQIPRLAGEAKSYSERLFTFLRIGELDPETDARDALKRPVEALGVGFVDAAVDIVVEYTQGYPYFLQEYGKFAWDEASNNSIDVADVKSIRPMVEAKLDEGFFRVRAERTTDLELRYLYAMATLGPEAHRAVEVARRINRTTEQAGPIRSRLIAKGLLFTPGHGLAAFTVPQFDRYMLRCHPDLAGDEAERQADA